jgi:carboxylesterase type B
LDDLLYIFRISSFPEFKNNSTEIKIIERMTGIWSNFAKTGEPIPKEDNKGIFANVFWEKFTPSNKKYLEIDNELVMKTNLNAERMEVWDELFLKKCV